MKTAISISDELLQEADATARLMGLSRSRLFAMAVSDFLQQHRQEQTLRRLNEVYGSEAQPDESDLLEAIKARAGLTVKDRW